MAVLTIDLPVAVEAYVELVADRLGMEREEVVRVMLEQYVADARAPEQNADESAFLAALQQTLTKHAELYRRLAQH